MISTKKKIINPLFSLVLFILYCYSMIGVYKNVIVDKNGWYLGEWVINYQDGGFKRRGLFGTVFIFLNELTNINLEYLIFAFLFLVYSLFYFLLINLFSKTNINLFTLCLLLLPTSLGMILRTDEIAGKKEILFFLFYLIYFLLLNKKKKINDLVITLFISIAILNHEMAFFYLPFISYLYYINSTDADFIKLKKILIYQLVPSVLLMIVLYNYGMNIVTDHSIEFLKQHGLTLGRPGIYGYDPNFKVITVYKNKFFGYLAYNISIMISIFAFFLYFKFNKIRVSLLFLVIQGVFLVPLFYIAYDWGRWVNIYFTLSLIFIADKKTTESNYKKNLLAFILIIFNFSWSMQVIYQGFIFYPIVSIYIQKINSFIF